MKNTICLANINLLFIYLLLNNAISVLCINLKISESRGLNNVYGESQIREMKENIKALSLGNNMTYYCLLLHSPYIHPSIKHSLEIFANELNSLYPHIIEMKYDATEMLDSIYLFFNGEEMFNKTYGHNIIYLNIFSDIVNKMSLLKNNNNNKNEGYKFFIEKYSIQPFDNKKQKISSISFIHKSSNVFNVEDILYLNNSLYANDKRFKRLLIALMLVLIFSLLVFILFNKSVKWAESSQLHLNDKRGSCIMEMISNNAILS